MLAKLATDPNIEQYGLVPIGYFEMPSTDQEKFNSFVDHSHSWMGPLITFLTIGELPSDKNAVRKLQYQAPRYVVMDGTAGVSLPYLRCVA